MNVCFKLLTFITILLTCAISLASPNAKHNIKVALTIDDLPLKENITTKVVNVLKKHHLPPTWGMLNAKKVQNNPKLLKELKIWIASENKLGNHTFSHLDLAKVSSSEFIEDINKNEPVLKKFMGNQNYKIMRYPYLSYGNTKHKYKEVQKYLKQNDYQTAFVTMDFFDSEWSPAFKRCKIANNKTSINWLENSYLNQANNAIVIARELSHQLFNRDIKYILLLHLKNISPNLLDKLLHQYENHGVQFITLESALKDLVYKLNPHIYRKRAYTLLNRIRLSRGLNNPNIVKKLYASLPENKLKNICRRD